MKIFSCMNCDWTVDNTKKPLHGIRCPHCNKNQVIPIRMDFLQAKRKKERGQTNEEFLDMVCENVKDFDEIAIVVKHPNGVVETWYSQENSLSLLGILEVSKNQVLGDMES